MAVAKAPVRPDDAEVKDEDHLSGRRRLLDFGAFKLFVFLLIGASWFCHIAPVKFPGFVGSLARFYDGLPLPAISSRSKDLGDFIAPVWRLPKIYEPINTIIRNMPALEMYATAISYQTRKLQELRPEIEKMGYDTHAVNICLDFQNDLQTAEETTRKLLREMESCLSMFLLVLPTQYVWEGPQNVGEWGDLESRFYSDATERCESARPQVKLARQTLEELDRSIHRLQNMTGVYPNYLTTYRAISDYYPWSTERRLDAWKKYLATFTAEEESRASRREALMVLHRIDGAVDVLMRALRAARDAPSDLRGYPDLRPESEAVMELLIFQHKLRSAT